MKFQNKVFVILSLLLLAQSFNDWWSIRFGLPTPVQLVIGFGVLWLPWKPVKEYHLKFFSPIAFYSAFVVLSVIFIKPVEHFDLSFLSVLGNLLLIIRIIPNLEGNSIFKSDIDLFLRIVVAVVGIVTIPTGFYEFLTGQNIIVSKYGLSEDVFYLRGLHLDKLEFGAFLALGGFISIVKIIKKRMVTPSVLWYGYVALFSFFLLLFSFSSTSLLGYALGVSFIFLISFKRNQSILIIFLVSSLMAFRTFVIDSPLFVSQNKSYKLKYSMNIEQYQEKNFRYRAFVASLSEFTHRPLVGYGIGENAFVIKRSMKIDNMVNSHNFFGNELVDYGLIGFTAIFLFVSRLFRAQVKSYLFFKKKHFVVPEVVLITGAMSLFLIVRLIFYYHRFDQSMYMIWLCLVLFVWILVRRLNTEYRESSINYKAA